MLILLNVALALAQFAARAARRGLLPAADVVARLLRVQALIYLTTPFIALPYALLAARWISACRRGSTSSPRSPARRGAGGALAGLGRVDARVRADRVVHGARASGMTIAARSLVWPSFDFRGAGIARLRRDHGGGQFFWFVQSQADVFIAGRYFGAHKLGIYTTACS